VSGDTLIKLFHDVQQFSTFTYVNAAALHSATTSNQNGMS